MLASARSVFGHLATSLADDWALKARPEQLAPAGDWWSIWLAMAGRGWGKTRSGIGWVRQQKLSGCSRIALVAPTAADCRDVLVEGPSGILATSPNHDRPVYESSKRRVVWSNGTIATLFSAEEGERLRGPEHDAAYCDELGSWPDPTVWDNLMFGLRIGKNPRACVTTTPRPTKLIRRLVEREGMDVVLTRGRTADNAANLSPVFLSQIVGRYEGTRMGRQELEGELLTDVPGALWQLTWIDRDRVKEAPKDLIRIVVAIDPAVTNNEGSDETGIMVAAVDAVGHGYLLEDISGRYAPHEWAKKAVEAFHRWKADRIIAEVNNIFGQGPRYVTIATTDSRATGDTAGPDTKSEDIACMERKWCLIDEVLEGHDAIKRGRERFLPRFEKESEAKYRLRLHDAPCARSFQMRSRASRLARLPRR